MLVASSALALPTNGDFSIPGLDSWTVDPLGSVTDGGGYALFAENFDYLPMSLSQTFTMPADSLNLSFDRVLVSIGDGGDPTTDTFTVSLLDAATSTPLIAYDPAVSWFYSLDNSGNELFDPAAINVAGNTVTLDVSAFSGQDVLLKFEFLTEDDFWITSVSLDNVNVSIDVPVVPAPGALLLAGIGTCLIGWFRRTKTM